MNSAFTGKQIAQVLGLESARRVQQLAKEGWIPKAGRGRYPLAGAVQGYCKYVKQVEQTSGSKYEHYARLKAAQAERTEIEVSEKLGELVPIETVVKDVGRMLTNFRQKMLALPGVLAPGLARLKNVRTIERYIKKRVHEALEEISGYQPN